MLPGLAEVQYTIQGILGNMCLIYQGNLYSDSRLPCTRTEQTAPCHANECIFGNASLHAMHLVSTAALIFLQQSFALSQVLHPHQGHIA